MCCNSGEAPPNDADSILSSQGSESHMANGVVPDLASRASTASSNTAAAPMARTASTSEPPPGFSRPHPPQQAPTGNSVAQKENGIAQNGAGGQQQPRARAWGGEPPESLGTSRNAGNGGAQGRGRGPAQLQRDRRSASGPPAGSFELCPGCLGHLWCLRCRVEQEPLMAAGPCAILQPQGWLFFRSLHTVCSWALCMPRQPPSQSSHDRHKSSLCSW